MKKKMRATREIQVGSWSDKDDDNYKGGYRGKGNQGGSSKRLIGVNGDAKQPKPRKSTIY